jgi:hypothetical protein
VGFSLPLLLVLLVLLPLLLLVRHNSDRVLAFSTMSVHLSRFKLFLTSSSHRDLGLPAGLLANSFNFYIFLTILVSGILFMSMVIPTPKSVKHNSNIIFKTLWGAATCFGL